MTVQDITAESWYEKISFADRPVIVNFSSSKCGFCRELESIYYRLSIEYEDKLSFLKVLIDDPQNKELLNHIPIMGTPTLKFYCRGREIGEHIGYASKEKLKKKIEGFLNEMDYCLKNSSPLMTPYQ